MEQAEAWNGNRAIHCPWQPKECEPARAEEDSDRGFCLTSVPVSQVAASHLLCLLPQDYRKPAGRLCAKALEAHSDRLQTSASERANTGIRKGWSTESLTFAWRHHPMTSISSQATASLGEAPWVVERKHRSPASHSLTHERCGRQAR